MRRQALHKDSMGRHLDRTMPAQLHSRDKEIAMNKTTVTEETSTAIIETQSTTISLTNALHIDVRFASAAIYGDDEPAQRRMTWATGNNDAFAMNGKQALPRARGWIIDQPDEDKGLYPDDYALIDAMELLVERGLAAPCLVVHQDEQGKPRRVPSWSLPVASLFVVCQGVPSKQQMLSDASERWGVAYTGWRNGEKSLLSLQFFVKELLDAGYNGSFYASFSGYLTDKALACLKAHEYTLRFADALRRQAGEDTPPAYYAYALPIVCSATTMTAGKEAGKTTEIYYPVPRIPRLALRNPEPGVEYLESVAITFTQAELLEREDRIERVIAWSASPTKKGEGTPSDDAIPDTGYEPVDMDGNPIKSPS
jgi:hypothetical protein